MKQALLAGVSVLAIAGTAWRVRHRGRTSDVTASARRASVAAIHRDAGNRSCQRSDSVAITRDFLLYFIVPLWTAAGLADWLCHRACHIEETGRKNPSCTY